MRGDLLGGGVVVAVAAALWLIYLVPTWLHRREYMATERNAVRLQQTLRILAETAETPREVHVEATAREVARQRKALKSAQRAVTAKSREAAERQAREIAERELQESARASAVQRVRSEAAAYAAAAGAVHAAPVDHVPTRVAGAVSPSVPRSTTADATTRMPARRAASPTADGRRSARMRRRMRAASSLLMLVSLVVIVWGVTALLQDGAWPALVGGIAMLGCAVAVLRRLARVGARRAAPTASMSRARSELFDQADHERVEPQRAAVAAATWTPRPLPKPLHLSHGTVAASAMASVDAAVELRRAEARAELERRAETAEPELPRLRPVAETAAHRPENGSERQVVGTTGTDGRYASMGVVEAPGGGNLDLDAVLRRRRG